MPLPSSSARTGLRLALALLLSTALASCRESGAGEVVGVAPDAPFSQAELDAVLDLSELGDVVTLHPDGSVAIGERVVPEARLRGQIWNRRRNVLQLSPEVLDRLPPGWLAAALEADAAAARAFLREHGLTPRDVHDAWSDDPDGTIDLDDMRELAERSRRRTGSSLALRSLEAAGVLERAPKSASDREAR